MNIRTVLLPFAGAMLASMVMFAGGDAHASFYRSVSFQNGTDLPSDTNLQYLNVTWVTAYANCGAIGEQISAKVCTIATNQISGVCGSPSYSPYCTSSGYNQFNITDLAPWATLYRMPYISYSGPNGGYVKGVAFGN